MLVLIGEIESLMMKNTKQIIRSTWILLIPLLVMGCLTLTFSPGISGLPSADTVITTSADTAADTQVEAESPTIQITVPQDILDEQTMLVDLYARANPSVVNITIFGELDSRVVPLGQGSGFAYDADGNIITNAHVVDNAEQVEVTFSNGTIQPAEIIGQDRNSDLAVIKVDQLPEGVAPLSLGEMDELAVGQTVFAIGNPFGLEGTLTQGIISALGRTIPALTTFSIPQSIQTDAAINPGNSGGPLLNLEGEVIGVNAQIETDGISRSNSGVGFAIPVSIVERVVPALIQDGRFEWSWLGVQGGDLTPVLAEAIGLSGTRGAYIVGVAPGGPAEKAGLQGASQEVVVDGRLLFTGGDVVTKINDQDVNTFDDLLIYIALQSDPGQEVELTILRDGVPQNIILVLDERPGSL
jgi:2-alkenal reductase